VTDVGAAYAEGRRRITDLVAGLDEQAGRAPVPACPNWSVHDVVAHLSGVCADVLAGRLDGVGTEEWTAGQVGPRADRPLAEVLEEWAEVAPQVEAIAGSFGAAGNQWVGDQATHEHDLRGALGAPGARDSASVTLGLDFMAAGFVESVAAAGLPPLVVRAGAQEWASAPGTPAATLDADPFEVLRSVTGRRTPDQVRSLGWEGDPDPYLPVLAWGPFRPPSTPVQE
jgi:uncharacterized protein (TIGR03083 family)